MKASLKYRLKLRIEDIITFFEYLFIVVAASCVYAFCWIFNKKDSGFNDPNQN